MLSAISTACQYGAKPFPLEHDDSSNRRISRRDQTGAGPHAQPHNESRSPTVVEELESSSSSTTRNNTPLPSPPDSPISFAPSKSSRSINSIAMTPSPPSSQKSARQFHTLRPQRPNTPRSASMYSSSLSTQEPAPASILRSLAPNHDPWKRMQQTYVPSRPSTLYYDPPPRIESLYLPSTSSINIQPPHSPAHSDSYKQRTTTTASSSISTKRSVDMLNSRSHLLRPAPRSTATIPQVTSPKGKERYIVPSPLCLDKSVRPRRGIDETHPPVSASSANTATATTPTTPNSASTLAETPISPAFPVIPENEQRQRRLQKLMRTLGEKIPAELVFKSVRRSPSTETPNATITRSLTPTPAPLRPPPATRDDMFQTRAQRDTPSHRRRASLTLPNFTLSAMTATFLSSPKQPDTPSSTLREPSKLLRKLSSRKAKPAGAEDAEQVKDTREGMGWVERERPSVEQIWPKPPPPPPAFPPQEEFRLVVDNTDEEPPSVASDDDDDDSTYNNSTRQSFETADGHEHLRKGFNIIRPDTPFADFGVPVSGDKYLAPPGTEDHGDGKFNTVSRKERRQGWSGEWNQPDIQDVIVKLRELR